MTKIDLTPLNSDNLNTLNLKANDLTEIIGLTQKRASSIWKLIISKNQLSCEFLKAFSKQLKTWIPSRAYRKYIASDVWDQKHGRDCVSGNKEVRDLIERTKSGHAKDISHNAPNQKSVSISWVYFVVEISIVIVIIIVVIFCNTFRKKFFKRRTSNPVDEPRISPVVRRGIDMQPLRKRLPEIPVSFHSSLENEYEEIEVHVNSYDHLRFSNRPKSIKNTENSLMIEVRGNFV